MPRSSEATRRKILEAAEELFAERGIDATTFAEINDRAGQRNNSATQYHFGDKITLLEAVIVRYADRAAERRAEMVAEMGSDPSLRDVVETVVMPLAEHLGEPGWDRYLVIQSAILAHPDRKAWPPVLSAPWERPALAQVNDLAATVTPGTVSAETAQVRRRLLTSLVFHSLAEQARVGTPGERKRFVDALIDAIVAIVGAPDRG